jgi:hypothetical protein
MIARILGTLGILALVSTPLFAQDTAPTPEDLTLRPGDKIIWTSDSPHRLRFGGSVTHAGAPLPLTPFVDVQNLLDLDPVLTAGPDGIALGPVTPGVSVKVTATVKASASAGAEFFFTCGFLPHSNGMVTVSFKIAASNGQPTRTVEIVASGPARWRLATASGEKILTRP